LTEGIQSIEIAEDAYKKVAQSPCLDVATKCVDLCREYSQSIGRSLANADTYNANAKHTVKKIKELDQKLQKEEHCPKNQRYMAT